MNPHNDHPDPETLLAGTRPVSLSGASRTRILARARETWNPRRGSAEYGFPWPAFSVFTLVLVLACAVQTRLYVPIDAPPVSMISADSPLAGIVRNRPRPLRADLLQAHVRLLQELTEETGSPPESPRSHRTDTWFTPV